MLELKTVTVPNEMKERRNLRGPPVMPVVIDDLLELGMQRGPDLNRVLELLHRRWEESGCRLGREELINSLYTED